MFTVLSWATTHGRLQLKCQKLRVGSYMEKELKQFNYPHARANPGCEVSCQEVLNQLASLLHLCFIEASLTVEKAVSRYKVDRLVASLTSFRSFWLSLVVCKLCAAEEEHCEWGHERVCANLWCLMSWRPKCIRTIAAQAQGLGCIVR